MTINAGHFNRVPETKVLDSPQSGFYFLYFQEQLINTLHQRGKTKRENLWTFVK